MKRSPIATVTALIILIMGTGLPALGQDTGAPSSSGKSVRLLFAPTSQDVILPISSIEWGAPDRWSFTSRYVHMFDRAGVRDRKRSLNNLTVSLSPGIGGGRFGIGYENAYDFKKGRGDSGGGLNLTLLSEARAVFLRTWGSPMSTQPGGSFAGGELRTSVFGFLNVGVGCYAPVFSTPGGTTSFWGLHAGVGI